MAEPLELDVADGLDGDVSQQAPERLDSPRRVANRMEIDMRRPDWTLMRGVQGAAVALAFAAITVVPSLAATTVIQTISDGSPPAW